MGINKKRAVGTALWGRTAETFLSFCGEEAVDDVLGTAWRLGELSHFPTQGTETMLYHLQHPLTLVSLGDDRLGPHILGPDAVYRGKRFFDCLPHEQHL